MASVVEIGSWKGRSTHALLSGCPGPVFAVDHFKGNPDENWRPALGGQAQTSSRHFWMNVGHFTNLVVLRMPSVEAAQYFAPKSVDMVFIDGCHIKDAVVADLKAWHPKCRQLLCGHDASYGDIQMALKECGIEFKAVNQIGLWRIDIWRLTKTLYTLNLNPDDYREITDMTYPLLKHYARKCDAEFFEITRGSFPTGRRTTRSSRSMTSHASAGTSGVSSSTATPWCIRTRPTSRRLSTRTCASQRRGLLAVPVQQGPLLHRDGRNIGSADVVLYLFRLVYRDVRAVP